MKTKNYNWLIVIVMVLGWVGSAAGEKTEWQVLQTLRLTAAPLDMIVSADNRWIYLLDDNGRLLIYDVNGQVKDSIDVGRDVDHIKVGPSEDLVFLLSRVSNSVQLIRINMIEDISLENAPVQGPRDAPVTIAVFSDFQCPYCARLVPVLDQVIAQYPRQVKIVYKQFPLGIHGFASRAAQFSIAAQRQGKFWEFHDRLFEHYHQLSDQVVEQIRTDLHLDPEKFRSDMLAPGTIAQINADIKNGQQAGVRGTPTVFVNGKLLRDKSIRGFQTAVNSIIRQLAAKK
jgi:protein-disulfide isomerase